jgi:hypothetical protein
MPFIREPWLSIATSCMDAGGWMPGEGSSPREAAAREVPACAGARDGAAISNAINAPPIRNAADRLAVIASTRVERMKV